MPLRFSFSNDFVDFGLYELIDELEVAAQESPALAYFPYNWYDNVSYLVLNG